MLTLTGDGLMSRLKSIHEDSPLDAALTTLAMIGFVAWIFSQTLVLKKG